MDKNQPWFVVVFLIFLGVGIAIGGYYINWYNDPPVYYQQYKKVKASTKITATISNDQFNFYNQANININSDDPDFNPLTCEKDHSLLYCTDGFTKSYVMVSKNNILKQNFYHKNPYQMNWQTNRGYDLFDSLPNMLAFDNVINIIINNLNDGVITEELLVKKIYSIYGNGNTAIKNTNKYLVAINSNEIFIKPDVENIDSAFPFEINLDYQKTDGKILINKNMFR